jgi:hypothetical protein
MATCLLSCIALGLFAAPGGPATPEGPAARAGFAAKGDASPATSQEIIPLSSTAYADMDALYLLTGTGTPSRSRPWSKSEALKILSRVRREALSGAEAALYDAIARIVEPGLKFKFPDGFEFGVGIDASLEAYYHSNTGYDLESDWIHGFGERKPMARLSLDFSLKDFLYLYCDMQYGRNRFNIDDDLFYVTTRYPRGIGAIIRPEDTWALMAGKSSIYGKGFLTNILGKAVDFNYQWPHRAVASVGGANWNISLARDKIEWGNGHSGNFILDSHVDYQEYARLVAFSDVFKYESLFVFLDANPDVGETADTGFRMLMAHRLEFRILKKLNFAISENVMYKNDHFDFRYLNPAFIYHNLNNRGMFNAIAHVELDFSPVKGLKLYAQGAMDQARAPTEGSEQADAMGYLGGIECAFAAGSGVFTSSLELAFTDPLLYRREAVDFLMFRKYYTNGDPTGPGYIIDLDYLGYPYGGDAIVLQWDGAYRIPGVGTIGARLFGMRHGAMNFFLSHNKSGDNNGLADYEGSTPSGEAVAESFVASLSGDFEAPKLVSWAAASVYARLDWIQKRTWLKSTGGYEGRSMDLQLTAGLTLSL